MTNKNKKSYFRTDGIRGRVNKFPMTSEIATKLAMATACVLKRHQHPERYSNRIIIGKDTRVSGYMFEQAITAGFLSMGFDVLQVGPIPTPGIAMLTTSMRADAGIMITASHNTFEDNGFKFFGSDGFKLDNKIQREIECLIEADLHVELASPENCGKATRLDDASGRYIEQVKSSFPKGKTLNGMKVVLDCANGAAYKIAPQILWELEADLIVIGDQPNGKNINKKCGATSTESLKTAVIKENADIGIALDGDSDRLIVIDENGKEIDGDQLTAALAINLKEQNKLSNDTVVATVMSNMGMEKTLNTHGIKVIRAAVGDRNIMEEMRQENLNLGGEQSGHIIMSEYSTTGDGILAALQILKIIKESNKRTSDVLNVFKPYPQLLKNVSCNHDKALLQNDVIEEIKKGESRLEGVGRILVRPSGTEPIIRIMAEGKDQKLIHDVVSNISGVIESAAMI